MLAFQKTPIKVHIVETQSLICSCCKDELSLVEDLYIKLSCGHEYHYDCIYSAFVANKKRSNNNILECPYCRKKVKPLPEKAGFNYDSSIHAGIINYTDKLKYKWSNQHMGYDYCVYCKDGKYCNYKGVGFGMGKKYCYNHSKAEHFGEDHCVFKDKDNYCNLSVSQTDKPYCLYHKQYINAKECKYVFQNGNNKGQLCKKLSLDPCGLCTGHLKYKDKIDKIIEKSNQKPTETVEKHICSETIKSGLNKGKICGIVNCKRHNKQVVAVEPTVNSTKIVELKGLDDPYIVVQVEKSVEDHNLERIIIEKPDIDIIKSAFSKLKEHLDIEGTIILNDIISKYFQ